MAGFQIGFDDIINIRKVSGLSAVAVDRRHFVMQKLSDKFRDHCGIHSVRILTAAENIEISKSVRIESV